jgi:signal transduction histidine kinase
MHFRHWFQPPHHLLTLFLATTLALASGLGWLGWRIIEQDRALEGQRVEEHLNQVADLISANLSQSLAELEQEISKVSTLAEPAAERESFRVARQLEDGHGLVVLFHRDNMDAFPQSHLLYYPALPRPKGPPEGVFATGERLEFYKKDYPRAVATYRELARSPDALIRAGALLREARVLRKMHLPEKAALLYQQLVRLDTTPAGGVPAGLVGRSVLCELLAEKGRTAELESHAHALSVDLNSGHWRLSRATYEFYQQEVSRWLPSVALHDPGPQTAGPAALALAAAVSSLWDQWQNSLPTQSSRTGHLTSWVYGQPLFVLWSSTSEHLTGIIVTPSYFERRWRGPLKPVGLEDAQITLTDDAGHVVLGQSVTASRRPVIRAASDTELPWTLRVASTNLRTEAAESASRSRLLMGGLGLMAMVVLAGSYFIARAVSRELEVARLQSDFVAAVSHEFRTPLASLLQRSELLADGRVSGEQQRREYYDALLRASQRLHRLVEGLLDFGRMEAGNREYRFERIDSAGLVQGVAEEFSQVVAASGYKIETTLQEPMPALRGDREALSRALWNLLDNAVKYSPDCKTVWMEAGSENGDLAIRVRDRGLGVTPAEQVQIFKKFVRASSARQAGVRGTGLGLAMVDRIAQAHGGHVSVENESGGGSTFTLVLPVARSEHGLDSGSGGRINPSTRP